MDVGAQLRRAREERDLSLSDLSQITKIRVVLLKALAHVDIVWDPPWARFGMKSQNLKKLVRPAGLESQCS